MKLLKLKNNLAVNEEKVVGLGFNEEDFLLNIFTTVGRFECKIDKGMKMEKFGDILFWGNRLSRQMLDTYVLNAKFISYGKTTTN